MSAILLPLLSADSSAGVTVDWDSFREHVVRTADAGLIPAVNMDTGYVQLLGEQQHHLPARLRAFRFQEAQVALGGVGLERQRKLAQPPVLAPAAQQYGPFVEATFGLDVFVDSFQRVRESAQRAQATGGPGLGGPGVAPKPVGLRFARGSVIAYVFVDQGAIEQGRVEILDILVTPQQGPATTLLPDGPAVQAARSLGLAVAVFFDDLAAQLHALITDIDCARTRNQASHLFLALATEGATVMYSPAS